MSRGAAIPRPGFLRQQLHECDDGGDDGSDDGPGDDPGLYPQGAVEIGLGGHVEGHGDLWKQFEQADDEYGLSGGDSQDEANEPDFEAGEAGFKVGLGGQFAAVGDGSLAHGADDGFGLGALKTRGLDVTGGGKCVEVGGGHAMKINDRGFERNPLTGFSTTAASRVR